MILAVMVCFLTVLTSQIQQFARITHLLTGQNTKELLRQQEVPAELYDTFCSFEKDSEYSRYDYLLGYLFTEQQKQQELETYLELLYQYQGPQLQELSRMEQAVWADLEYFPVPLSWKDSSLVTSFENSWMFDRSFGGNRGHEGTDIMASFKERGHYPVVSITDGTVEKVGWLKLGGYRIGIRSPRGVYFYYAHLNDYAPGIEIGDEVSAGELLGFMGDTGYSEQEGTTGYFPVHLHVGIYFNDEDGKEQSYNPYPFMKKLESEKLKFCFE